MITVRNLTVKEKFKNNTNNGLQFTDFKNNFVI